MNRREFLAALGASTALAGCNGPWIDQRRSTPSTNGPISTASPSPSPTKSPTPVPVCVDEGDTRLPVGEWYEGAVFYDGGRFQVTVSALALTTTFRDGYTDQRYEMPDDEQLAVATVRVVNQNSRPETWAGSQFSFVVSPCTAFESQYAFDHPDFEQPVTISQLPQVDHARQHNREGYPLDPEERGRLWAVAVLPRDATRQDVEVGLELGDERGLPVRWVPE